MLKNLSDLLLLGDPRLYEVCEEVSYDELPLVSGWVADMHNVMEEIRAKYNFGRGIAAPQLGILKRLIYINMDEPEVIINPVIVEESDETFELWDDCMSFPNLLVRVERKKSVKVEYRDQHWNIKKQVFRDDRSELFQHEFDHLNGVLCTMRAIDDKSFKWKS